MRYFYVNYDEKDHDKSKSSQCATISDKDLPFFENLGNK